MPEIKDGVGMPVKASPSDEIRLRTPGPTMMYGIHEGPDFNPIRDTPVKAPEMKLNYEKQLKRLYALLNAGGTPARITEEIASDIYDDVADMQMSHNGMEDALKHERAETKILSVAISEIYRSLYGYEPTPLSPIEVPMTNIRSRIEQLKSGPKYTQQDSAKEKILELTECLRGEPFAGDTSSLTLEEVINLLSVAIANKLPAVPAGELEEAIERIYNSQYTSKIPSMSKSQLDRLCTRIEDITKWNKAALVKTGRLESEIAQLHNQTSSLRFAESRALEKRVDVWADRAVKYRSILSATARHLRDEAHSLSVSDVQDLVDAIEEEMKR